MRQPSSTLLKILAVIIITALAWTLRWKAVQSLPVDYDEDDYMRAAQQFAILIRAGDWPGFLETNYRIEHPPLSKILFGIGIVNDTEARLLPDRPTTAEPDKYIPKKILRDARTVSAILGTATVALLAWINPIGAIFLGFHSFTIKYVSQIMLEALPALTSLITVFAYIQSKKKKQSMGWLLVSAFFLGATAASKYIYCLVGIAILIDWFLVASEDNSFRLQAKKIVVWGIFAIVTFIVLDPYLWPHLIERLKETIFYHAGYAKTASEVSSANFPMWQPLTWLTTSPSIWHKDVFVLSPDRWITVLAVFGISRLWMKERLYVIWLGVALLFLLAWPTKWPQYILVLTAPLSLAAAETVNWGWEKVWKR